MAGKRILSAPTQPLKITGEGWVATFNHNHLPGIVLSKEWHGRHIKCSGGLDINTIKLEMYKFDFWAAAKTARPITEFELSPKGQRILQILTSHLCGVSMTAIADEMELARSTVTKVLHELKRQREMGTQDIS